MWIWFLELDEEMEVVVQGRTEERIAVDAMDDRRERMRGIKA